MTTTHYYRCGCTNWAQNNGAGNEKDGRMKRLGYVQIVSNDPPQVALQHSSHDNTKRCNRYMRFSHSVESQQAAAVARSSDAAGITALLRRARQSRAPTIAVMWSPHTEQWHHGACGHGQGTPQILADRLSREQVDPQNWVFGANCAEVHCVINAGLTAEDTLAGCRFIAYNTVQRGFYGACRSCSSWIRGLGGTFYAPRV